MDMSRMKADIKSNDITYPLPIRPMMPLLTLGTPLLYAHHIKIEENKSLSIYFTPMSFDLSTTAIYESLKAIPHEKFVSKED